MTTRPSNASLPVRAFATGGWGVAVVGAVGGMALRVLDPAPIPRNTFGMGDVALVGLEVMGVAFASVGALLVIRQPRNAVGWCMVVIGAGFAGSGLAAAATFSAIALGTDHRQLAGVLGWLTVISSTIAGLIFALPFIFPTGRGHTLLWNRMIRLSVGPWLAVPLMLAFQPGPLHLFATLTNPFGFGPDLRAIVGLSFTQLISTGAIVVAPVGAFAVFSRYQSASEIERRQLKWFLLASVVSIAGVAIASGSAVLSRDEPAEVGLAVFGFAGTLIPVAIGIAILRHHLYDIDRLIGRTIAYAAVTGALTLVFAATMLTLTGLLAASAGGQTIAVAASTLVVFALFQPLRRRAQAALDRRFGRERYDAERTLDALAERLRSDMDLQSIDRDVIEALAGTFHPSKTAIWLRPVDAHR